MEFKYFNNPYPGAILCMRPTNERRRYNVTSSRIGWAYTQNDHWAHAMKEGPINIDSSIVRLCPHMYILATFWHVTLAIMTQRNGPTCHSYRLMQYNYRQTSSISRTKSKKNLKCFSSRLAVVFAQSIEARC